MNVRSAILRRKAGSSKYSAVFSESALKFPLRLLYLCITVSQTVGEMTQENIGWGQLILSLIGALGLRELAPVLFGAVFRRREDVESARIENSARLEAASREQILFLKDSLREAYEQMDKMQDDLNDKRALINELSRKLYNIELEVQLARQRDQRSFCANTSCPAREAVKKPNEL